MNFKTWDDVVTFVYWQRDQLPPRDTDTYNAERARIKAFHIEKGYPLPTEETE